VNNGRNDRASFERVFNRKDLAGRQTQTCGKPRASYRYVSGVEDFSRIIRFDEMDLISNTNEIEISLTKSAVHEARKQRFRGFSWQVSQAPLLRSYFRRAIVPGQPT